MLAVADTRVADDIDREHSVLVFGLDEGKDLELVDSALHGHLVLAGLEDKVGNEREANGLVVDGKVHGNVAEIKGHN